MSLMASDTVQEEQKKNWFKWDSYDHS
jgi:hypothetical protein